ncbi:MAG: hypothetical protein IKL22_07945 [Lachnospiraceae bacterium]|nr:hypothetical protein [Lachnospiraceae bacterium]
MNYVSAHLWEKEKACPMCISLILQHALVGKREVLLACVCESKNAGEAGVTESGYFSEGLTEWFHREGVKLCDRKEITEVPGEKLFREIKRLEEESASYLRKYKKELHLHYWGVLLWDSRAWVFARGDCKGYLLNRRFQKKNIREIIARHSETSSVFMTGSVQKKVGMLLCTDGFGAEVKKETLAEVLIPDRGVSGERMERRLKELAGEGRSAGAVYIRIC